MASSSSPRLLLLDCDSTLSSIEGIDELGRVRGEAVFKQVEAMTNEAMDGKIPVEAVFRRRLEIIQPRRSDVDAVGRRYVETVEPGAATMLREAVSLGWTPIVLSGGFRQAILPLAAHLGISRVEAVDLFFNADGSYAGYDVDYPTTRSGGKPEVVERLRTEYQPAAIVMVGDGVSDLETQSRVSLFVGFGRYVKRPRVQKEAQRFVESLDGIPELLRAAVRT